MKKDLLQNPPLVAAICILLLAIIIPYWKLTTLQGFVITDDVFTSDIMNESFPYRLYIGEALKHGEAPTWLPHIYGGIPLLARAEAGACYPLNLVLFGLLPPYVAVNAVILLTLMIGAVGMFFYAREVESGVVGAVLAGVAFAYCGFMVSHIKHLSTIGTVCWFPLGLLVIERAYSRAEPRVLVWLAAIIGLQNLSGHIQTAYYSGLVYVLYFTFRAWKVRRTTQPMLGAKRASTGADRFVGIHVRRYLLWGTVAVLLGGAISAVQLIPTYELVQRTQRSGGVSFDYASSYGYDMANWKTFFYAVANGEISNATYRGNSIFWEDYGYVGIVTLLLAIVAAVKGWKKWQVKFHVGTTLLAYVMVLGPHTPVYELAFRTIPGMEYFRFPTRFLFVVDASLCLLAAIGMTQLDGLFRRPGRKGWAPAGGGTPSLLIVALVLADLFYFQLKQNPIVDAGQWLRPPAVAQRLKQEQGLFRVYSPGAKETHKAAFASAGGWDRSLQPYLDQREFLQPNLNVLYGLFSADGYAQLTPNELVDIWGDQNRSGFIMRTASVQGGKFVPRSSFVTIMNMWNVKYLLSPWPLLTDAFVEEAKFGQAYLYRNPTVLPRAYIVERYRLARGEDEAIRMLLQKDFDPAKEAILYDVPGLTDTNGFARAVARVESYRTNEVIVKTFAEKDCLLVLSDTFYPGWKADLDGNEVGVLKGNVCQRIVAVPKGDHVVRFHFDGPSVKVGLAITVTGLVFAILLMVISRRAA